MAFQASNRPLVPRVAIYFETGCANCEQARTVLERVRPVVFFDLEEVDVDSDPMARALYGDKVPAVTIAGQLVFRHQVDEDHLIRRLRQAVEDLELEAERELQRQQNRLV